MNLAPILLFVYNRPHHTKLTIEALQKNELAKESELFIYSDAPKDEKSKETIEVVRNYIKSVNGFKNITIIEREKNWGLADSIINGVTNIVNEYGKVIVLEDDLVTSPYFLRFMNDALEFYKDEKRVWHISGWNYPIKIDGLHDVFLWRLMNCWGWATWADRWEYFEKDTDKLLKEFTTEQIEYLNLEGYNDAWSQVILNKDNKINSWAIYWYAVIIKNNALCLNPVQTCVENIGLDGSGVHCGIDNSYKSLISKKIDYQFEHNFIENNLAVDRIKIFYKNKKKNLFVRGINKVFRLIIGRNLLE